jgi:hypothetical protein
MKTLSKQEIYTFFEFQKREHYKKRGRFLFRSAVQNETILTIVDGKLETLLKTKNDEIILRNIELGSSAETYVIAKDLFEKRYVITEENHIIDNQNWTVVLAKGEIEAFCYSGNLTFHIGNEEQSIQFMAP